MDHTKIVKNLYFSKDNILNTSMHRMAEKVYLQERTLFQYRQKYCEVVEILFSKYNDNNN
jgi:hypothetical protein